MLTKRQYQKDDDLALMLDLASRIILRNGIQTGTLHQGDLIWGLFQNETRDPTTMVSLVEDAERGFAGYLWFPGGGDFMIASDPDWPDQISLNQAMMRLAEQHLLDQADPPAELSIEIVEGDTLMEEVAEAEGYRSTGNALFRLSHRGLDAEIALPNLPDGAVVRAVGADLAGELEARVALHQDVWESSKFSLAGYRTLRQRPVFRPDLDLVAVTPAGELAAYAIVWFDPTSLVAEFEPVGASTNHRRQGYASAVMLEGLRRAKALGATDAIVYNGLEDKYAPSRALYERLGFNVVGRCVIWSK